MKLPKIDRTLELSPSKYVCPYSKNTYEQTALSVPISTELFTLYDLHSQTLDDLPEGYRIGGLEVVRFTIQELQRGITPGQILGDPIFRSYFGEYRMHASERTCAELLPPQGKRGLLSYIETRKGYMYAVGVRLAIGGRVVAEDLRFPLGKIKGGKMDIKEWNSALGIPAEVCVDEKPMHIWELSLDLNRLVDAEMACITMNGYNWADDNHLRFFVNSFQVDPKSDSYYYRLVRSPLEEGFLPKADRPAAKDSESYQNGFHDGRRAAMEEARGTLDDLRSRIADIMKKLD